MKQNTRLQKQPLKNPPGNRTEGTKKYKDPTGHDANLDKPRNSGYDEKQPK